MTERQLDLARRLVATEEWDWPEGLKANSISFGGEFTVLRSSQGPWMNGIPRTELYVWELSGDEKSPRWRDSADFLPDLSDDSTGGVLLARLLRGVKILDLVPGSSTDCVVRTFDATLFYGTLAEACAEVMIKDHPNGKWR
jgi:hypothetical protein